MLVAVLGGVGTLWGPLMGAAILVPLGGGHADLLGRHRQGIDLIIYGLLIMVISVVQPGGIMGFFRRGGPPREFLL